MHRTATSADTAENLRTLSLGWFSEPSPESWKSTSQSMICGREQGISDWIFLHPQRTSYFWTEAQGWTSPYCYCMTTLRIQPWYLLLRDNLGIILSTSGKKRAAGKLLTHHSVVWKHRLTCFLLLPKCYYVFVQLFRFFSGKNCRGLKGNKSRAWEPIGIITPKHAAQLLPQKHLPIPKKFWLL